MAKFHFVEDYERHVDQLIRKYPLAEAMSLAVGGSYEQFSVILAEVLVQNGLSNGMMLVDLGCGSGRAATGVAKRVQIDYLGTDVVEKLLRYARSVCPKHYQFKRHQQLSIPIADLSTDMVAAFSFFTHLLHEETYIYLQDAFRILKPGGQIVMSFLEFGEPSHWGVFTPTAEARRTNTRQPLNTFIERSAIDIWCSHLGFERIAFVDGHDKCWNGSALGQSIAVLRKPA
jgi:ubiquinone/menaquinone biosynthesis C-methylase UbiE